jgi:hypothetical protein
MRLSVDRDAVAATCELQLWQLLCGLMSCDLHHIKKLYGCASMAAIELKNGHVLPLDLLASFYLSKQRAEPASGTRRHCVLCQELVCGDLPLRMPRCYQLSSGLFGACRLLETPELWKLFQSRTANSAGQLRCTAIHQHSATAAYVECLA